MKVHDAMLTDRLDRLEQLVDERKITRKAYEKARDKYWIRHVMDKKRIALSKRGRRIQPETF